VAGSFEQGYSVRGGGAILGSKKEGQGGVPLPPPPPVSVWCIGGGFGSGSLVACDASHWIRLVGTGGTVFTMSLPGFGTYTQHICSPDCNGSQCMFFDGVNPAVTTNCCTDWILTLTNEGSGFYGISISLTAGGCGGCCTFTGSYALSGLFGSYFSGVSIPGYGSPSEFFTDSLFVTVGQDNPSACYAVTPPECAVHYE
jgi:hypothetical protein